MGFVKKVAKGFGKAIGLIPDTPKFPSFPSLTAPTLGNSALDVDAAAQKAAAAAGKGMTSTLLTGGAGEDENKLKTSKILLGQ